MKIGIGYANDQNALKLGGKVAEEAIKNGRINQPMLVIAFCGGQVDHNAYFKGLQTLVGRKTPIIGGSAIGVSINCRVSLSIKLT